jgi:hypothetical protein
MDKRPDCDGTIGPMGIVALAFGLLFVPQFCFAWGGQGHQVIAIIAARLTNEARAQVKELLGDADMAACGTVTDDIRAGT